ncbi:hypothetical protein DKE43_10945 [Bacillus pumilus]|nr:hypothetical protein DKE43_10945 [Bacillus pumilus]
MSVLRAGAYEYQIRSAPVLVLPRIQGFPYHADKGLIMKKTTPNSGRFHVIYELENLFNFYNARHFF